MTMSLTSPNEAPFIGVDVASKHLDAAVYQGPGVKRLNNTRVAVAAWLSTLPAGSRIALESTGRYHELLASQAHAGGHTVYLLNPRDVRHYARGLGMRGKTDRLDAQVLARYAAHEHCELRAWQPQPAEQRELDDLLRRRALLVKQEQALKMSVADSRAAAAIVKPLLAQYRLALGELDKLVKKAAAKVDAGSGDFARITSVPGIGLLTGAALIGLFRRLATGSADAVIAFLGLDPRPMDSGQKSGKRRLSKRGPPEWRRLLFNAARSASLTSTWKPHYSHECAKNLPATAALNILARKLVRVAFGLFKARVSFDPSRVARVPLAA